MAVLHIHKCVGCGYTIWSSKGGDYNLMCGPGHFYICPQCKVVFPKSWVNMDICLTTEACSYAEDVHFADLLAKTVPDDLQEIVLKDVKWFQGEVMKGDKSKYYGHTCLTTEMAYNNARLIACSDSDVFLDISCEYIHNFADVE